MSKRSTSNFEYSLRRFDPTKMDKSRCCVFIGGSGTGKSHLVTSILYHNRDIPAGIVFSGTEEGDPYFRNFVPDSFIYSEWKPEKLEDLIDIQKKSKRRIEHMDAEIEWCRKNGRRDDEKRLLEKKRSQLKGMRKFVVIDDIAYKRGLTKTELFRKVFMNSRHWQMLTLFTVQYCIDLDISLRGNAGYVFVCREAIISYRRKIYENFLGMLPNFSVFEKVMDSCTQNYECLVLDRTARSTRVEDCLFWYRAEPSYNFRLGSERFWDYHRTHYDRHYEDRLAREQKAKREQGIVRKTG